MDDNEDFVHLAVDEANADDEEGDENEPRPIEVSRSEIEAQLREAARQKKAEGAVRLCLLSALRCKG